MLIPCPECNTKVSDKAQACPQCGFRIDSLITCPDCGKLVRPGTMVCPGCGYPFAQKAPASPVVDDMPDSPSTAQPRKPVAPTGSNAGRRPGNNADYPKWQYRESGVTSSVLVSTNEILRRIADGRMLRTVEVWTKGADKWRPASNYVALSAESTSKVVSAQAAKSQPPAKNEVTRGTKRLWYYAVQRIVNGPTSADDIYRRILDGRLPPNVSVWMQGSSDWAPATEYVLFSKEGPDATDVMEQDSLLESDTLPLMVSIDGRTRYRYSPDPDDTAPGTYTGVVDELTDSAYGPHPWIRYFARMFDFFVYIFILVFVVAFVTGYFGLSSPWLSNVFVVNIVGSIAITVFLIPIESLWLCLCGTTPGKWLLGISVSTVDGHKPSYGNALRRSAVVAYDGMGFGIGIFYLFGLIRGWRTLNRANTTPWDLEAGTVVHHHKLSALGILVIVVAIAGYLYLVSLGSGAGK